MPNTYALFQVVDVDFRGEGYENSVTVSTPRQYVVTTVSKNGARKTSTPVPNRDRSLSLD